MTWPVNLEWIIIFRAILVEKQFEFYRYVFCPESTLSVKVPADTEPYGFLKEALRDQFSTATSFNV